MLTIRELVRSVYGTWRLAHLDPGGMVFFDATPEGFWRSFRVAVLLLPIELLALGLRLGMHPSEAGLGRIVAVDLVGYAVGWMAFPLAAHYLVVALGREKDYIAYIVAYNWSSILQMGVHIVVLTLAAGQMLPELALDLLDWIVFAAVLYYIWFIAKTALRISPLPAAGLVVIDVMISFLIAGIEIPMMY
jgi:hypothetical protein